MRKPEEVKSSSVTRLFQRRCIAKYALSGQCWCGPACGVSNDTLHIGMVIRWQRLMAGTKIEDLARAACVAATTSEDLATCKPAHKDQCLRGRNIEVLTIHLFVLDLDIFTKTLHNRMTRRYNPETLTIATLAPLQSTGRPHQASEDLCIVTRVEHNEPHSIQHTLLHTRDNLITHLLMSLMPPPDKHIGRLQHLIRQAVLRLIQRCCTHLQSC